MSERNKSVLPTVESILALAVFLVLIVLTTNVPVEYPAFPTLGGVPINPELVVPGVFGVVVLVNTVREGFGIWSVVASMVSIVTVLLASLSFYVLSTTNPGMFMGSFYTIIAGTLLALLVLGRRAVDVVLSRRHSDTASHI